MKKTYSKPAIVFEDFTLSTNIAAGCKYITDQPGGEAQCGFDYAGWGDPEAYVFIEPLLGCAAPPPGDADSVCYHVPVAEFNIYSS